jgi:hypothetical protein
MHYEPLYIGTDVQPTSDNGYIILGYDYTNGNYGNIWIIKTDVNGEEIWVNVINNGQNGYYWGHSICQTSDLGYLIIGNDLIKTNANGQKEWALDISGIAIVRTRGNRYFIVGDQHIYEVNESGIIVFDGTFEGRGNAIIESEDGSIIICGTSQDGVLLMKLQD